MPGIDLSKPAKFVRSVSSQSYTYTPYGNFTFRGLEYVPGVGVVLVSHDASSGQVSKVTLGATTPSGIFSDDFEDGTLKAGWTEVDPGGFATWTESGGVLSVTTSAGGDAYNAPAANSRMLQAHNDTDFDIAVKWSVPEGSNEGVGLWMDDGTNDEYLRYDIRYDPSGGNAFTFIADRVGGTYTTRDNASLGSMASKFPNGYIWLRLKRVGSTVTCYYRATDGAAWTQHYSFTCSVTASRVGPHLIATAAAGEDIYQFENLLGITETGAFSVANHWSNSALGFAQGIAYHPSYVCFTDYSSNNANLKGIAPGAASSTSVGSTTLVTGGNGYGGMPLVGLTARGESAVYRATPVGQTGYKNDWVSATGITRVYGSSTLPATITFAGLSGGFQDITFDGTYFYLLSPVKTQHDHTVPSPEYADVKVYDTTGAHVATYTGCITFAPNWTPQGICYDWDTKRLHIMVGLGASTTPAQMVYTWQLDQPPTTTITSPTANQKIDPRLPLTVAWTSSDADGNPQAQWEVGYSANGSTWTTATGTTESSHVIPANTLTDETGYSIRARTHDGTSWGPYHTISITADSWTYEAEVVSATQSGTFTPTGAAAGETLDWGVRTHDGTAWGPWSTEPAQVTIGNLYTPTGDDSAPASDSAIANRTLHRSAQVLVSGYKARPGRTLVGPVVQPVFSDPVPATVTDSVTVKILRGRSTTEHVGVTDIAERLATFDKQGADAAPVSDSASRNQTLTRVVGDSTPAVDDGVQSPTTRARAGADSIVGLTDAATRYAWRARTGLEPHPTTESATRSAGVFRRTTADTAPVTEALTQVPIRRRTASDSAPATDSDPPILFTRTGSDSASATDALTHTVIEMKVERTATDAVPTATDSTLAIAHRTRLGSDTAPASDAVTSGASRTRTGSDVAPSTEVATRLGKPFRRAFSETLSTSEAPTSRALIRRTGSDAATATDALARSGTFRRTLGDAAPVTDDGTRKPLTLARPVTETLSVTDAAVRSAGVFRRTPVESAPATDSVARQTVHPRSAGDAAPASDALASPTLHPRTVADTATASDQSVRVLSAQRTASDAAPVVQEDLASPTQAFRTSADAAPATDTAARWTDQPRTGSDAAPASDSVVRESQQSRTATDALVTMESVESHALAYRSGADSLVVGDVATRQPLLKRSGVDAAPAEDVLTYSTDEQAYVADAAPASDAVVRRVTLGRTGADAAPVIDGAAIRPTFVRSAADSLPVTSATSARAGTFARTLGDSAPVIDDGTRLPTTKSRAAQETLVTTDQVSRSGVFARTGADAAAVTESARKRSSALRTSTDAAPVSDRADQARAVRYFATDLVPMLDTAVRTLGSRRTAAESIPLTVGEDDTYFAFRNPVDSLAIGDEAAGCTFHLRALVDWLSLSDGATAQTLRMRTAEDLLSVPSEFVIADTWTLRLGHEVLVTDDYAYALVGIDFRLTPRATITSVSREKVSHDDAHDTSVVTFTFDQPVQAWAVRLNSTSHLDGTSVEVWEGSPTVYGLVTIPSRLLRPGVNRLTIYGQSLRGIWGR